MGIELSFSKPAKSKHEKAVFFFPITVLKWNLSTNRAMDIGETLVIEWPWAVSSF